MAFRDLCVLLLLLLLSFQPSLEFGHLGPRIWSALA